MKKNLTERELTKRELEKREDVINALKTNRKSFVSRYGKDAEKVMYAIATKRAKNETENMQKDKIKEMVKSALMKPMEGKKSDMDGDGDIDSKDYLLKRDAAIKKAMAVKEETNPMDVVAMDVPLLIRMMEFAREDAKADLDLHNIAEKAIALSSEGRTLTMSDYETIFGGMNENIEENMDRFLLKKVEEVIDAIATLHRNTSTNSEIPTTSKEGLLRAFDELSDMLETVASNIEREELDEAEKPQMFVSGGNINPELVKKVEQFVKGVAKYYDYSVDDAFLAIMTILKGGLRKENIDEITLDEAYVPDNIKKFAKQRGVSSLVNKAAGWAEKVGKGIKGGTAIGKNYSTLILDMGYQTSDIYINTEDETIELYGEEVNSFPEFKKVYDDHHKEDLDENSKGWDSSKDTPEIKALMAIADDTSNSYTERDEARQKAYDLRAAMSKQDEGLSKGYWAKKIPGGKMEESYATLVNKLKKQGKSEKASKAIAGAVASYKAKGGGSGPTAKQAK